MFSISIFSILFEWWLKMKISSISFKKRILYYHVLARAIMRANVQHVLNVWQKIPCFERLTKNSILQSWKVIVYLFAKDFYFLTRAIICARTYCVLKHEIKIWFRETIIVCVGKINWQWNILYLKNSHKSFFL